LGNKVVVLMATYNGMSWLPEQVESILRQSNVNVKLIVSDDASSDGSRTWLQNLDLSDDRVQLLPGKIGTGSPGKNFYRLILDADIADADFIAFADQDDIWLTHKLADQIEQVHKYDVCAVSSNVVAFWADGSRYLINKSEPKNKFDFLFESAGPGCSFMVKPVLLLQAREVLEKTLNKATLPELHDWFIYAVCRAFGEKWHIDQRPLLKYRQHGDNAVGVNFGMRVTISRFNYIRRGWYRGEVQKISRIVMGITTNRELHDVCLLLTRLSFLDRCKLILTHPYTRRNYFERILLTLLIASFTF